ncbi:MAG: thiol reductant ABC exporter subunit CydC [Chloroflexi bacterium CFX4]|nr:thiol reductant ABC exporter subunit CydC [Chloroflexi bacterium CFX4]MDL1922835.1 thiol reductant ABC exporter subunit CydC [Chloroflexi bacterium CFX3]
MTTLRRLISLLTPYRRWISLSVLLGFLTVASSVGLLATSAWIISRAAERPSIAALSVAVVGVRFFGITRGVFRYLERLVSHETTFHILAGLRVWFYGKIAPLAPARLMQFRSGDLLSRAIGNIETLQEFYVRAVAPPLVALLIALLMAVFFAAFDLILAITVISFMLATSIGVAWLARRLTRQSGAAALAARSALNANVVDMAQGMADVVAFNAEARQAAKIQADSDALSAAHHQLERVGALQTALISLLINLCALAVLILAAPRTEGIVLATLVLAAIASFEAIAPLPIAAAQLSTHLSAAQSLYAVVDADPVVSDPSQPQPMPSDCTLDVEGLRFRYAEGEPYALDGINFSLPQGRAFAIVGASGGGKTTLVNLLLRFWDYREGQIRLGGVDIRQLAAADVRQRIGVVTQQTYLFNTSIRENLLIAKRDATEGQIIAAAQRAQLHDFIMRLPQGYETRVGEFGVNLSGGERQRLAIARALLKDAPLLVLDEPTANLDAQTERSVLEAIRALMAGRTTLLITHRLVGLDQVDQILVLQSGKIVERGTQAELLAQRSVYQHLYSAQREWIG